MTSNKQIEANKKNAKLGGIKTQEGKEISKWNALKHGILSEEIFIQSSNYEEDKKLFNQLKSRLIEENGDKGVLGEFILDKILVNFWRQRRVHRVQSKHSDKLMETSPHFFIERERELGDKMYQKPDNYSPEERLQSYYFFVIVLERLEWLKGIFEHGKVNSDFMSDIYSAFSETWLINDYDEICSLSDRFKDNPSDKSLKEALLTKTEAFMRKVKGYCEGLQRVFERNLELELSTYLLPLDYESQLYERYENNLNNQLYKLIDYYKNL